jgi:hypothetical protein
MCNEMERDVRVVTCLRYCNLSVLLQFWRPPTTHRIPIRYILPVATAIYQRLRSFPEASLVHIGPGKQAPVVRWESIIMGRKPNGKSPAKCSRSTPHCLQTILEYMYILTSTSIDLATLRKGCQVERLE